MLKIELKSTAGRDLQQIADELRNGLDDVLTAIGTELAGYVSEDFETKSRGGTGAAGIRWDPLDPKTIKKKAKRAKGGDTSTQIGVDTGLLRSTIQPGFKAPSGDGAGVQVSGNEVTVGFGRRYAKYFDEGNTRGMPARTLIPDKLPKEWEEAAEEIVANWIEDIWAQRFGR